jgi:hypothetical protein
MRVTLIIVLLLAGLSGSVAQDTGTKKDTTESDGRKVTPDNRGQAQPQGPTGPIETKSGGEAPASSAQGDTPPGMQVDPTGSPEKTVSPPK